MIQIHSCIAGFTQGTKTWHGVLKLHERMTCELNCNPICRVWFHRWKDDWESIAEHIWLLGDKYQDEIEVYVYCYSYGGGWGAIKYCNYLDECGLRVPVMVMSDPVYRNPLLIMRWTSLVSFSSITIPENVGVVHRFYQRVNKPCGHNLKINEDTTMWATDQELHCTHQKMDDSKEFHDLSIQIAKEATERLR